MKDQLLSNLEDITSTMDVPTFRRTKVAWLKKHIAERNGNHPQLQEAQELIDKLLSMGIR